MVKLERAVADASNQYHSCSVVAFDIHNLKTYIQWGESMP